jgi:hypothetical protein
MNSQGVSGVLLVLCALCVKAVPYRGKGFNTEGTENTENAMRRNFVSSSRQME